jgi:hypothetical protein
MKSFIGLLFLIFMAIALLTPIALAFDFALAFNCLHFTRTMAFGSGCVGCCAILLGIYHLLND